MEIKQRILTKNDCYRAGRTIRPHGIMVHSTATPGVMAEAFCKKWNASGTGACVHAFVDDSGVYQCLPWTMRGWHAGGSANDTHISFEICEPKGLRYNAAGSTVIGYDAEKNRAYFEAVWENATALCALLCREYGMQASDILCHSEGYARGIATNHADTMHWFPLHGKSMDDFREAVAKKMKEEKTMSKASDWAAEACDWAVKAGLFQGDGSGEFHWQEPVTRETAAALLYRYHKLTEKED